MGTHVAERKAARHYEPGITPENEPRPHGRRALQPNDSPTAVAVSDPTTAGLRRVAVSTLSAGSLLAGLVLVPGYAGAVTAKAVAPTKQESPQTETQAAITAASDVTVAFDAAKVTTQAAPVVVKPEPAPVAKPVVPAKTQVAAAPAQAPAPAAAPAAPAPAPAAPAAPVQSDRAASIVAAAYAQIGVTQDCTMLVTRSLAAVGIKHHGWPVSYYSLGYAVSAAEAKPGDLIYYVNGSGASIGGMAHIAIYVGNGMAVHGGWDGWTTKLFSVNVGSGPNYIRLR